MSTTRSVFDVLLPRLVVSQEITSSLEPQVLQVGGSGLVETLDRGSRCKLSKGKELLLGLRHILSARASVDSEPRVVRIWLLLNVGSPLKFGCLPNMIRLGDFFAVSRLVVKRIRVLTLASSLAFFRMSCTTGSILSFE